MTGIYWGEELLKRDGNISVPIIDGLLWERDTILILGKEKVGKSIFAMQMAGCLTVGEPFLDTFKIEKPCEVLYVQAEGKRHAMQSRIERMSRNITFNPDNFTHIYQPFIEIDTSQGSGWLRAILKKYDRKPRVIFIDPLYMSMAGRMEDAQSSKLWIKNVRTLCEHYGAALVVVHHSHRTRRTERGDIIDEGDDSVFGSFAWKAFVDHVLLLTHNTRTKIYTMSCTTQREANIIGRLEFVLKDKDGLLYTSVDDTCDMSNYTKVKSIIEKEGKPIHPDHIEDMLGIHRNTIFKALRQLQESHEVEKVYDGRRVLYQIKGGSGLI